MEVVMQNFGKFLIYSTKKWYMTLLIAVSQ